jgi:predicted transcriptional regulator
MAEKKTMILTIRVEESVGKALKELAEADERKLSAYVARVLRRHIDAETKDKAKPKGQR